MFLKESRYAASGRLGQVASRETKRFEARMRSARLRHVGACPEDVDYRARRGLDKALFQSLLTGRWITDKRSLIITGPARHFA